MADLVEVLNTPRQAEARLVAAALSDMGLRPTVLGEGLASVLGAGQHIVPCRVMVPGTEAAEARAAIAMMQEASNEAQPPREACPECGAEWEPGFDVCWRCDEGHGGPGSNTSLADEPDLPHSYLHVDLDRVHGRLPHVASRFDYALLAMTPLPFIALSLLGGSTVLAVVLTGVVFAAAVAGFRRTTELRLDGFALTVGDERMLWEELDAVTVDKRGVAWRTRDGHEGIAAMRVNETHRRTLQDAIQRQLTRPRGSRDRKAEAAMRDLLDR